MWLDEWVNQPGDSIPLAIEQGLENLRTLVLVMSQAAFTSERVTSNDTPHSSETPAKTAHPSTTRRL